MLNVNNINKIRRSLQVTVCTLNKLLREAYETEMILEDKNIDFDLLCEEKSGDQPTFKYWYMVVIKIILLYLAMMKSIRDGDFEDYKSILSAIMLALCRTTRISLEFRTSSQRSDLIHHFIERVLKTG